MYPILKQYLYLIRYINLIAKFLCFLIHLHAYNPQNLIFLPANYKKIIKFCLKLRIYTKFTQLLRNLNDQRVP